MGLVVLADETELKTIKISELAVATSMTKVEVLPGVIQGETKQIKKENFIKDLEINGGEF